MQQITIVFLNGSIELAAVNNRGESIQPELTEERIALIQALSDDLAAERSPEEQMIEKMMGFIRENADDEAALDFFDIWPPWESLIGKPGVVGTLTTYGGDLYRIHQYLDIIHAHHTPDIVPAHYELINKPGDPDEPEEYEEWTPGSWAKGARVWRNGRLWESQVPNNTWEPGAPGVYDNVWKDVTEEVGHGNDM